MATSPTPPTGGARPTRTRSEQSRLIAIGILSVVVILFAVLNFDRVKVHLLFGTPRMPLILVIVICALIGFAIGWAAARRSPRKRRP